MDERAKPGDIVFLASLRLQRLGDQWGTFDMDDVMARARSQQQRAINQQALAEAQALVGALRARGLQVPMDAPKPLLKAPPFRCADWFNRRNPVCAAGFDMDRQFLLAYREATMDSLRALERDNGVHLWDRPR